MVKYPGIRKNLVGNDAIGLLASRVCDLSGAYPITPSSGMSYLFAQAAADGTPNAWGRVPIFIEAQSEHGSASMTEGMAMSGLRSENYTSSQGLKLMNEVLYSIAGKRLPVVFHIGSRALTTHALNIFDDNSDVMSVLDVGWGMIFGRNVQQAADLGLIARRAAELSDTPFFNVQSGFFTTMTLETLQFPEDDLIREYLKGDRYPDKNGLLNGTLINLMHPKQKLMSGAVQGQQHYFDGMAAQRELLPSALVLEKIRQAMREYTELTGRKYEVVQRYRSEGADYLIVLLNSHAADTAMATVDYLRDVLKKKVGLVSVVAFVPFPAEEVVAAVRKAKAITVIEKVDHRFSKDNPLTAAVKASLYDAGMKLTVYSCSAGLGGVETTPGQLISVAEHMEQGKEQRFFYIGANSPLSLKPADEPDLLPKGAFTFVGGSLGGLGAVGAGAFIADLLSELSGGSIIRAAANYGAEKMGLPTTVFATIAKEHIRVHCQPKDFQVYMAMLPAALEYPDIHLIERGGMFIMESGLKKPADILKSLPEVTLDVVRKKKLTVMAVDVQRIAAENAPPALAERMKGVAFTGALLHRYYRSTRGKEGEWEELEPAIKAALERKWGSKGASVVQANLACVRDGYNSCVRITPEMHAAMR